MLLWNWKVEKFESGSWRQSMDVLYIAKQCVLLERILYYDTTFTFVSLFVLVIVKCVLVPMYVHVSPHYVGKQYLFTSPQRKHTLQHALCNTG
jgi:hypothetical protein